MDIPSTNVSSISQSIGPSTASANRNEISGIVQWFQQLFDYFLGYGDQLTARVINETLDAIFNGDDGWDQVLDIGSQDAIADISQQKPITPAQPRTGLSDIESVDESLDDLQSTDNDFDDLEILSNDDANQFEPLKPAVSWRSKSFGETLCVVSSLCTDLAEEGLRTAGTELLSSRLKDICQNNPTGKVKALIPIGQAGSYALEGNRGHCVLLEVDIEKGRITQATLHDAKAGLLDTFYQGANRITTLLSANGLFQENVAVNYHGDQSLLNGKDCGRFSTYYAEKMAKELGGTPQASDYWQHFKSYYPKI